MDNKNLSLGAVASCFLASLTPEAKGASQQEIYKFVRWFGGERPLAGLTAAEVANYAERLSISDTDYLKKLELLRGFLISVKKQGWSKTNLSVHLKAKKKTAPQPLSRRRVPEAVLLTRQGYDDLKAELEALQSKRLEIIDEIRRAAADKDFRENAPLAAARERRGQLEGRIRDLEETLKSAMFLDERQESTLTVSIGDSVILSALDSGEELRYMLVSPSEVDPARGKISSASPIGRALIGRNQGDTVEVVVPVGKLRYQIKKIEH